MDFISTRTRRNKKVFYNFTIKNVVSINSDNVEELKNIREDYLNKIEIKQHMFIKKHKRGYFFILNGNVKLFHVRNSKYNKFAFLRAKNYFEEITDPESFYLNFI